MDSFMRFLFFFIYLLIVICLSIETSKFSILNWSISELIADIISMCYFLQFFRLPFFFYYSVRLIVFLSFIRMNCSGCFSRSMDWKNAGYSDGTKCGNDKCYEIFFHWFSEFNANFFLVSFFFRSFYVRFTLIFKALIALALC